jgi:hypothetical protein
VLMLVVGVELRHVTAVFVFEFSLAIFVHYYASVCP